MQHYTHINPTKKRIISTLFLLLITGPISTYNAPHYLNIPSDETEIITRSTEAYLFIGKELSPLQSLLDTLTPLALEENYNTIITLKNRKTAPKKLVARALEEMETLLNNRHQAIPNDDELKAIVTQLDICKELIQQDALLITDRAPRPPLKPGGITENLGSPNPGPESGSESFTPGDLSIVHNLYVGNDATIAHNLAVGGNTTITGPLSVTSASSFLGTTSGGLHGGGTSEPGDNNLLVDGLSTFTGPVLADGGMDAPATLTIGPSNATSIIIGNTGSTTTILGTTDINDKLITLNKDGAATSGGNCGIQLEEAGISDSGYLETSTNRNSWIFKAPNATTLFTITPGNTDFTVDRSIGTMDSPTFSGLTIANHGTLNLQTNTSNQVTLQAPVSLGSDYTLTLPNNAGDFSDLILSTAGPSGLLSWIDPGGAAGNFINGGNFFTAPSPARVGTTNNQDFYIITGTPIAHRIEIGSSGTVTIVPDLTLNSNLNLAASTIVNKNGGKFLHTSGSTGNLFLGFSAGDVITTGTHNVGAGSETLKASNGSDNTAIGNLALTTAGSISELTAIGSNALLNCFNSGIKNTAVGFNTLSNVPPGANNTALGHEALKFSLGSDNTGCGKSALSNASFTGNDNTALGSGAGSSLTSGSNTIIIGKDAGSALTTETNTICIGCTGDPTGPAISRTYSANIYGTSLPTGSKMIGVTANHQLGTHFISPLEIAGNVILNSDTTFGKNRIQQHATSLVFGTTVGALPLPPLPNIHYLGRLYSNSSAPQFGPTTADRFNLAFNYRDTRPTTITPEFPNPAYGTAQITVGPNVSGNGGVFVAATAPTAITPIPRFVIYEDGTIDLASSNQITINNAPYITQKAGTSFYAGLAAGSVGAGGINNTSIGYQALPSLTSGTDNTAAGSEAGGSISTGIGNCFIGYHTGNGCTVGSESYNIFLGENVAGTVGQSNRIRIGNQNQNDCILFSGGAQELHAAGSIIPSGTMRVSWVAVTGFDGAGNPIIGSHSEDIISVVKYPSWGRTEGAFQINYKSFSTAPSVTVNEVLPSVAIWNQNAVCNEVTSNWTTVYTFDHAVQPVLVNAPFNALIIGLN